MTTFQQRNGFLPDGYRTFQLGYVPKV